MLNTYWWLSSRPGTRAEVWSELMITSTKSILWLRVIKVTRIPVIGAPPSSPNVHSSRTEVGPMSRTVTSTGAAGAVREIERERERERERDEMRWTGLLFNRLFFCSQVYTCTYIQ